MSTFWNSLIAWLIWLSAEPGAAGLEAPKAAAAVAAARASMLTEAPSPTPTPPSPTACDCGQTCVLGIWKPDGRIEQRCACKCRRCEAERAKGSACASGTCPLR